MKASEYFGDWMDVIDTAELRKILSWISTIDKTTLCPSSPNIFKAFRACPLKDCKVVFLGQDPYPQQGVATGILFGNSKDTPDDVQGMRFDLTPLELRDLIGKPNWVPTKFLGWRTWKTSVYFKIIT